MTESKKLKVAYHIGEGGGSRGMADDEEVWVKTEMRLIEVARQVIWAEYQMVQEIGWKMV